MEKKIELINEIIRIYDENEKLKKELEKLGSKESITKEETNPYIRFIDMGRKNLFDGIFYSWSFPSVLVDPTNKNLVFLDFNQWFAIIDINAIHRKEYLSYYSLEQLKDYFRKELEEEFNTLKEEIIEELKEKENQDKEE